MEQMNSSFLPVPPSPEVVRRNQLDATFRTVTCAAEWLWTTADRRMYGPWFPVLGQYQLQGYYNAHTGVFMPIGSVEYVKYEVESEEDDD